MAGDNDVNVKFGAQVGDALAGVKEFKGHIDGLSEVFGTLTAKFAALAAVVAGGAAFKEFINTANELNGTAKKLASSLGITAAEAGTLNTALGDIYSDADTYIGAMQRFGRQLRNNEDALKDMGLKTRDTNGALRDSRDLMSEAVAIVGKYKQGFDQSGAAMTFFGRNVGDVMKLGKLNNKLLEEAAEKNKQLNLEITEKGLQASAKYKAAMNDVGDVLEGLKNTIGQSVLPRFTDMANKLATFGPTAVESMQLLVDAFLEANSYIADTVGILSELRNIFTFTTSAATEASEGFGILAIVLKSIMELLSAIVDVLKIFATVIEGVGAVTVVLTNAILQLLVALGKFATGDWTGGAKAMQTALENTFGVIEAYGNKIGDIIKKGEVASKARWGIEFDPDTQDHAGYQPGRGGGRVGAQGTKDLAAKGKDKDDGVANAQAALEKAKLEASLSLLKESLSEAQQAYDTAFKNNLVSIEDYYTAKLEIEKRGLEETIATKRAEIEVAKTKAEDKKNVKEADRIKFQTEQVKLEGEINVLLRKRTNIELTNAAAKADAVRQQQAQLAQIRLDSERSAGQASLDQQKADLQMQLDYGLINREQQIAGERDLADKKLAADEAYYAKKIELANKDPVKLAEIDAQLIAAHRDRNQKMNELDKQSFTEQMKYPKQFVDGVQSSFRQMFFTLANGTATLTGSIKTLFGALGDSIIGIFAEIGAKWVANQVMMMLFGKTAAQGKIATSSAEAGAAGVASWAGAPWPINMGAPAFGAAMFAAASAFAVPAFSFDTGVWQIPTDTMAMVHAGETVLPKNEAENYRQGAAGGGVMTVNINAVDAASIRKLFMDNGNALADAIRRQSRNFNAS